MKSKTFMRLIEINSQVGWIISVMSVALTAIFTTFVIVKDLSVVLICLFIPVMNTITYIIFKLINKRIKTWHNEALIADAYETLYDLKTNKLASSKLVDEILNDINKNDK